MVIFTDPPITYYVAFIRTTLGMADGNKFAIVSSSKLVQILQLRACIYVNSIKLLNNQTTVVV
jgi:hypothetical protein